MTLDLSRLRRLAEGAKALRASRETGDYAVALHDLHRAVDEETILALLDALEPKP